MSNHSRCAACRFLRRRCPEDCIFSPYFPSTDPQRFACVHKIYGASNVSKMLQQIPVHLRAHAADSIFFEAHARIQDPIYGCVGIISRLQHEIYANQRELASTQAAISFNNAQQAQAQGTQIQQLQHADEAPGFIGPFHMDQSSVDHHYHVPGFLSEKIHNL
ncbi:hypothetical protein MRB53_000217 [Persea americana]|uniref:Uncharacterized protein n=1 Tax=Persea americana TaxID=3435 RepID=A0ACC2MNH2_PERAE|nr:hypothetical protein MRB53_000217 [Persea americana]